MFKYILSGVAAGVAIGLLFAPKCGVELREDLSDQVNDSLKRGKTAARRISKQARELGEQAHQQLRDAKDAVRG